VDFYLHTVKIYFKYLFLCHVKSILLLIWFNKMKLNRTFYIFKIERIAILKHFEVASLKTTLEKENTVLQLML